MANAGTRINSNAQSKQMMKPNEITINIKIESKKSGLNNDAELRKYQDAITNSIQKQSNTSNFEGYNDRFKCTRTLCFSEITGV